MALPGTSFPIAHSSHFICWVSLAFMKALIHDDIHHPWQPPEDFLNTSFSTLVTCGRLTSRCLRLNTWAGAPWVVEFAVGGWSRSWGVDGEAEQTCALEPACGEEETSNQVSHTAATDTYRSAPSPCQYTRGESKQLSLWVSVQEQESRQVSGMMARGTHVISHGRHRHKCREMLFGGNMERKRGKQTTSSLAALSHLHYFLILHCQPRERHTR